MKTSINQDLLRAGMDIDPGVEAGVIPHVSRRNFLRLSSAFPVFPALLSERPNPSFQLLEGDGFAAFHIGGVPLWEINTTDFSGLPRLSVVREKDNILLSLHEAFYPGTTIPASFEARVFNTSAQWLLSLRGFLGGFECVTPFIPWLLGHQSARSGVQCNHRFRGWAAHPFVKFYGDAQAEFFPNWNLQFRGRDIVQAKLFSAPFTSENVVFSFVRNGAGRLIDGCSDRMTLLTMQHDGSAWSPQVSVPESFRLKLEPRAFDRVQVELSGGSGFRGLMAEGSSPSGAAVDLGLIVKEGRSERALRGISVASVQSDSGTDELCLAKYDEGEFSFGSGGANVLASTGELQIHSVNGRITEWSSGLSLRRVILPMEEGVYAELRYQNRPVLDDPGAKSIRYCLTDEDRLIVIRPRDGLYLAFTFDNVELQKSEGKWKLLRARDAEAGEKCYFRIHFQPQHIAEEAIYETAADQMVIDYPQPDPKFDPKNDREKYIEEMKKLVPEYDEFVDARLVPRDKDGKLPEPTPLPRLPVNALISGESRLVFEVPDIEACGIPVDLRSLLAWHEWKPSIAPVARDRKEKPLLVDPLNGLPAFDCLSSSLKEFVMHAYKRALALYPEQETRAKVADALPALKKGWTPDRIDFLAQVFPDVTAPPELNQTSIELPYSLLISPSENTVWRADRNRLDECFHWVEAWGAELLPKAAEPKPGETGEKTESKPTFRAIYSPDVAKTYPPPDKKNEPSPDKPWPQHSNEPFRMSMDGRDRHEIVHLTSNFSILTTEYPYADAFGLYNPLPVQAELLRLTPLGGYLRSEGVWEPPCIMPKESLGELCDHKDEAAHSPSCFTVERWNHRANQGRDNLVKVVYKGYIFPYGHRASLVKETQRRIQIGPDGNPTAYLRQRMYIQIKEPAKVYPAPGQKFEGRGFGFEKVTFTVLQTPPLDEPNTVQGGLIAGMPPLSAFWPTVAGVPFVFDYTMLDPDKADHPASSPLIFVNNEIAHQRAVNLDLANALGVLPAYDGLKLEHIKAFIEAMSPLINARGSVYTDSIQKIEVEICRAKDAVETIDWVAIDEISKQLPTPKEKPDYLDELLIQFSESRRKRNPYDLLMVARIFREVDLPILATRTATALKAAKETGNEEEAKRLYEALKQYAQAGALQLVLQDYQDKVDRRTLNFEGEKVAYAKPTEPENTAFNTNRLYILGEPLDPERRSILNKVDQAPFYPYVAKTIFRVAELERMGAPQEPIAAKFYKTYLEHGFDPQHNRGEVYLEFIQDPEGAKRVEVAFGGEKQNADQSGGVVTPNVAYIALSRVRGPVGGKMGKSAQEPEANRDRMAGLAANGSSAALADAETTKDDGFGDPSSFSSGNFNPIDFFGGALKDAKILGGLKLWSILKPLAAGLMDNMGDAPNVVSEVLFDIVGGAHKAIGRLDFTSGNSVFQEMPETIKRRFITHIDNIQADLRDYYTALEGLIQPLQELQRDLGGIVQIPAKVPPYEPLLDAIGKIYDGAKAFKDEAREKIHGKLMPLVTRIFSVQARVVNDMRKLFAAVKEAAENPDDLLREVVGDVTAPVTQWLDDLVGQIAFTEDYLKDLKSKILDARDQARAAVIAAFEAVREDFKKQLKNEYNAMLAKMRERALAELDAFLKSSELIHAAFEIRDGALTLGVSLVQLVERLTAYQKQITSIANRVRTVIKIADVVRSDTGVQLNEIRALLLEGFRSRLLDRKAFTDKLVTLPTDVDRNHLIVALRDLTGQLEGLKAENIELVIRAVDQIQKDFVTLTQLATTPVYYPHNSGIQPPSDPLNVPRALVFNDLALRAENIFEAELHLLESVQRLTSALDDLYDEVKATYPAKLKGIKIAAEALIDEGLGWIYRFTSAARSQGVENAKEYLEGIKELVLQLQAKVLDLGAQHSKAAAIIQGELIAGLDELIELKKKIADLRPVELFIASAAAAPEDSLKAKVLEIEERVKQYSKFIGKLRAWSDRAVSLLYLFETADAVATDILDDLDSMWEDTWEQLSGGLEGLWNKSELSEEELPGVPQIFRTFLNDALKDFHKATYDSHVLARDLQEDRYNIAKLENLFSSLGSTYRQFTEIPDKVFSKAKVAVSDLKSLLDFKSILNNLIKDCIPKEVSVSFDWKPTLKNFPESEPIFVLGEGDPPTGGGFGGDDEPAPQSPATETEPGLVISVRLKTSLRDGNTNFDINGQLSKFGIRLLASPNFINVYFKYFKFESHNGSKPKCQLKLSWVELSDQLEFVKTLQEIMSPSEGFFIDIKRWGVTAGFAIAIPSLAVGIFGISNISLRLGIALPFDGSPVRLRFGISSFEKPFAISATIFGGRGYFALGLGLDGVEMLEGALELGVVAQVAFGIAEGQVAVVFGIYMRVDSTRRAIVCGYLRACGTVNVLGLITIGMDMIMSLCYDRDPSGASIVRGEATVKVWIKLLFLKKEVSIHKEYIFAGSAGGAPQGGGDRAGLMSSNNAAPALPAPNPSYDYSKYETLFENSKAYEEEYLSKFATNP